jgi:hypothetical protein
MLSCFFWGIHARACVCVVIEGDFVLLGGGGGGGGNSECRRITQRVARNASDVKKAENEKILE